MVGFIPWLQIIALLRRPRIVYDFGCVLLGAFKRLLISRSRLVVTADTVFTVTDIAWASASGPLAGNEGSSTITFGSSFAAGGQLNFDASRSAGIRWENGSVATNLSEVTSTNFGLNSSGDNLYIYNGTTVPASATALEWIAGFATNPFLVSGSSSSSLTFLPSVFTVGNFALSLGITVRTNTTGNIISGSMLNSIDAEPTALQLTYRATNLPSSGTLRFSSAAVVANVTSFMQNNINSCRLTYDGPSIEQTMSYR